MNNIDKAFIHGSYAHEKGIESNQRLEFLGDSVLDIIITEALYKQYPNANEGWLSKARMAIVNNANLAKVAKNISLDKRLKVSKACENMRNNENVLADCFEAWIGARFLDYGFADTKDKVLFYFREMIKDTSIVKADAKTELQEWCQANGYIQPEYKLMDETGPANNKQFQIAVFCKTETKTSIFYGSGSSKSKAGQDAAALALKVLKGY